MLHICYRFKFSTKNLKLFFTCFLLLITQFISKSPLSSSSRIGTVHQNIDYSSTVFIFRWAITHPAFLSNCWQLIVSLIDLRFHLAIIRVK